MAIIVHKQKFLERNKTKEKLWGEVKRKDHPYFKDDSLCIF